VKDFENQFSTVFAPGLEEDDLFAAMYGMPGEGALWGEGVPDRASQTEPDWTSASARQQRHEEMLKKWHPIEEPPPDS